MFKKNNRKIIGTLEHFESEVLQKVMGLRGNWRKLGTFERKTLRRVFQYWNGRWLEECDGCWKRKGKRWKSGRRRMALPDGAKNFSEIKKCVNFLKKAVNFLKMQWLLHWYIGDL